MVRFSLWSTTLLTNHHTRICRRRLYYIVGGYFTFLLLALFQPMSSAARIGEDCRIDLVLVIDSSGSVQRVFKTYIAAALEFTKDLTFGPQQAHAAIVQYSRMPPLLKYTFDMPQSNEGVNQAISQLEFLGDSTFTAEAVNLGLDQFDKGGRPDARKIFVLMTDGNSINPWKTVIQTTNRLRDLQATNVYIIALGDNLYFPELKLYTGNGSLITKDGLDRFKAEVMDLGGCPPPTGKPQPPTTSIVTSTAQSTAGPPSSPPSPPTTSSPATPPPSPAPTTTACPIPEGYCPCSTTSVVTSSSSSSVTWSSTASSTNQQTTTTPAVTEAPSTTKPPIPVSPCAVDILFVLDSSGANRTNFDRQIRFILDILDLLVIQPDGHLVAAVVYDGHLKQRIQFSFTAYKDIQALSAAISALPFFGGTANTGEALTLAKQALKDRRGTNVPALVFVVTNGTSADDVTGPAATLRKEPNTTVYSLSATDIVDKQQLANIAGDPGRVFAGMESENIKQVGLGKYLTCFRDNLTDKQRLFL